ncbi:glycosyltransferase involved in cell wall biosynthesis [Planomicrobium stackebrandtii]|uniref:Glycosyltransferase involved in cell wall biosynthesis n=1 Tax=Planomicrobium stackebrandtii TaxID=253160 RepID=A0ABU0GU50_9BACL|nr:glycosyltransferase family 4 protein [Planomicrobium stackebrandtii]MDQ0428876.1 glycosyltransferase involved in cell wall biosynthesis [Planomicrobium stackebrandtii]
MAGTKKGNLIFVGPLPPPILGESIALQSLYKSEKLHQRYKVKKINLSRKDFEHPGALSFDKVWTDSFAILYSGLLSLAMKNPILYISISQTKMGLLRDCMMIQACKLLGRGKVVTHLHGNNLGGTIDAVSGTTQKFIVNSLKKIDVGIVLGGKLSPNYRGHVKRIEVVSNGIPADFILKSEVGLGNKKGAISLLYLSNLMFEKGYVELIKATTALIKEGHNLRLDLVGGIQNESEFQEVRQYIAANEMDHRIQYHGLKQGDEKKRFFLESDMMALPTKYKVEGQPMSIIEGMAAGLPIISSDRGIIAELIKDCGVIIEPTVEGVKAAIKDLVVDDAERMRLGRMSRETFEEFYTEDKYTDALIAIFDEL